MALSPTGPGLDPEVCSHWRLAPGRVLGNRASGTWEATRDGVAFVVKYFNSLNFPDWRYTVRVAAALRAQGWPTPELVEEPLIRPGGAWVLLHRLPGRSMRPTDEDKPAEERSRGRLLAQFHSADVLATHYSRTDRLSPVPNLEWQIARPGVNPRMRPGVCGMVTRGAFAEADGTHSISANDQSVLVIAC